MSQVCRSRAAWMAWLLVISFALQEAGTERIQAAASDSSAKPVLETFVKPDGQAYFALKLAPQAREPKAQPHDVVVLFDTSASQIGAYRTKALGTLRAMLTGLSPADRVALIAVDVSAAQLTPAFVQAKSVDLDKALAALERRVPLGSTDMREALDGALKPWADSHDASRARSVVYIGDGFSNASVVPLEVVERLMAAFTARRASFSSFAIGPQVNGQLLGAMANHTGGMLLTDDPQRTDRQLGNSLAAMVQTTVVWPIVTNLPGCLKDAYPRQMPPLRFDRDSILVGLVDQKAIDGQPSLEIEMQAIIADKPMTLHWAVTPERPHAENAYLAKVVELAAKTGGIALPTAGTAGLDELRLMANAGARQLARLSGKALARGRIGEAAQLVGEAERLDPAGAESELAQIRAPRPSHGDLQLVRTSGDSPAAEETELPDGQVLNDLERQNRIVTGFLQAEVTNELNGANSSMASDPDLARDRLKLLLEKVQSTPELSAELRGQMVSRIESGLRAASHRSLSKTQQDLQQQQAAAAVEARQRLVDKLSMQEEKIDQLMSRFDALMDEERYRDAEGLAVMATEVEPATPGLRTAELNARMVGYTANNNAVRDASHTGFVDTLFQVDLSAVPQPDDPPIVYPGPEVWQLITERRRKFNTVDLTNNGPNEKKIMEELDENTDIDFSEQALSDVVDYLSQRHGIEIQLDRKALSDAGVGSDIPITRTIKGIKLRSALKLLLGEHELTYVIHNEVLMITSKTEAENMLSHRVYPVADLTVPIAAPRNMGGFGGNMGSSMLGGPGSMGGMGGMGMGGMGGVGGMGMGGMGGMGGGMGMPGMGMGFF